MSHIYAQGYAVLTAAWTGQSGKIGYALYTTSNSTTSQAWSSTNIVESKTPGTYNYFDSTSSTFGIPLPDNFRGRISWGYSPDGGITITWLADEEVDFYNQVFNTDGTVNDSSATAFSFIGSSSLSSTTGQYVGSYLYFTSGTNKGAAARIVISYDGPTRRFTFVTSWPNNPANGDVFSLQGGSA